MREGDDFFLNDDRVVMSHLVNGQQFSLMVYRGGRELDGIAFHVRTDRWTALNAGVHVQAGDSQSVNSRIAKVRIDAPKDVVVMRGAKYRSINQEN